MGSRWTGTTILQKANLRGHIVEFDGLRAVGLSLVLLDHFWVDGLPNLGFQLGNLGWIAMDSFFVLSGLLITGILLDSREKPDYFKTYYVRRTLRIFPLYYTMLLIWYLILRLTNNGIGYKAMIHTWGSPMWFTFYAASIHEMFVGNPDRQIGVAVLAYAPLWSLQIEEQFYLLFPMAVAWLRKEHLRWILIGAIVMSPILRVITYFAIPNNPYFQYVELPCHCEGLALGALMAIRFRSGPWEISKLWLTFWTTVLLGGACAGSILSTWGTHNQGWGSHWDRTAGYSISSAGCACLVLWLICFRDSKYTQWLRLAPLRYLGKISYGVYLLHPLAMWVILELIKKRLIHYHKDDPLFVIEGIGLSLVFAAVSWQFFESPILKLKDRVTRSRGPMLAAVSHA
jgi:peptidoglycan/LPS O-acetylase OafA/YrhL